MMINQTFEAISTVHGPFGLQMQISENDVFLFDIDAVSNAHQREMNHAFGSYLSDFARHRACYLLTSCNYAETATRIPSRVRRELAGIFSSAGTELWHRNELLVRHEHSFSDDIYECIVKLLLQSSYPAKQTPLIDCGPATLRICLAGTRAGLAAKRGLSGMGTRTWRTRQNCRSAREPLPRPHSLQRYGGQSACYTAFVFNGTGPDADSETSQVSETGRLPLRNGSRWLCSSSLRCLPGGRHCCKSRRCERCQPVAQLRKSADTGKKRTYLEPASSRTGGMT